MRKTDNLHPSYFLTNLSRYDNFTPHMLKTKMLKKGEAAHLWYIVNAEDKILGRAASKIASLLKGKNRPDFTPHVDSGAGVIVLNCDKVKLTGNKRLEKIYMRFSGYPGGLKKIAYDKMLERNPKYILRHAVKGMLPKTKLGMRMLRRLKLYTGTEHPHAAQKPIGIEEKI